MSCGALINLVRLNPASETAPDHDYTDGEIFERYEEIQLVDPSGSPCAIPEPASLENIDYKYNLITGAIQHTTLAIRRSIGIGVDYLDNEVCRRLEHWMQQRALVRIAPNMGRATLFSWRPVEISGTQFPSIAETATDLTGNVAMQAEHNVEMMVWDYVKKRFAWQGVYTISSDPPLAGYRLPFIHSQGGAAIGMPRGVRNLFVPPSPEGAAEGPGSGKSGWDKGGADAGDLTFTLESDGFGHKDCPDSLKVSWVDTMEDGILSAQDMWDPSSGDYQGVTMSSAGLVNVCVWLRGMLPEGAFLIFNDNNGATSFRDISGERMDGWTPIFISLYSADWSVGIPQLLLLLSNPDGVEGSIEVGPTMVAHHNGARLPAGPYWTPLQTTAVRDNLRSADDFTFPPAGWVNVSFVVPEAHGQEGNEQPYYGLLGNDNWGFYAGSSSAGVDYLNVNGGGGSQTKYVSGTGASLEAGKINNATFAWDGRRQVLFLNGVNIGELDRTAADVLFGVPSELRLGYDKIGNGIYPGLLLSVRIDEGSVTDDEVMNLHLALTDPIALQTAAMARGRVFQITGVPQTLRSSEDGSQVLGNIQLEQVDNQHWLADPLNKEESVL